MKERPILFSAPMVRAILAGKKTQTRRMATTRYGLDFIGGQGMENDPECWGYAFDGPDHHGYMVLARGLDERHDHGRISIPCPYGAPGDRLWVKETFNFSEDEHLLPGENHRRCVERSSHRAQNVVWRADGERVHPELGAALWKPAIHMPRWASRITLEVTSVRVERLQDISEEDARAEGAECPAIPKYPEDCGCFAVEDINRHHFRLLWDSINCERAPWSSNPWVWVVAFKRVQS